MKIVSILGTVGVPAAYGGFETLADNLACYHEAKNLPCRLVVYCSGKAYPAKPPVYRRADLEYIDLDANGVSSILYDIISLFSAVRKGSDVILLLGVSGALALPLVRFFSSVKIVTNIDGIEWKREKWRGAAKWFLRMSEYLAVKFSHVVIADNGGIAGYVSETYKRDCEVIAYGGDHAIQIEPVAYQGIDLPKSYAFALCRIEPENNVEMILEAFSKLPDQPLVFIGNWGNSAFGRSLKEQFSLTPHLYLLDPIYDLGVLRVLRENATVYVHGHSAGGTNPSLVEMMHFGIPIIAYDCIFNRFTTENKAFFFNKAHELRAIILQLNSRPCKSLEMQINRRFSQEIHPAKSLRN